MLTAITGVSPLLKVTDTGASVQFPGEVICGNCPPEWTSKGTELRGQTGLSGDWGHGRSSCSGCGHCVTLAQDKSVRPTLLSIGLQEGTEMA